MPIDDTLLQDSYNSAYVLCQETDTLAQVLDRLCDIEAEMDWLIVVEHKDNNYTAATVDALRRLLMREIEPEKIQTEAGMYNTDPEGTVSMVRRVLKAGRIPNVILSKLPLMECLTTEQDAMSPRKARRLIQRNSKSMVVTRNGQFIGLLRWGSR
jgi:hypothetical protein